MMKCFGGWGFCKLEGVLRPLLKKKQEEKGGFTPANGSNMAALKMTWCI